jgi:nickel-dependent lactate racemase
MPASSLQLPWGNEILSLPLPEGWQLSGVYEPSTTALIPDPEIEIYRALSQPVEMPRIADLVRPEMKIVVVIDDISRPTPVRKVFPAVMSELNRAGIPREAVTVIPALGLHRPMEAAEIAQRTGMEGLKFENPDCDDLEKQVLLGVTARGTPVWINKTVASADLIVSIGCIEPHIIASFGGGYKNLVPGVAGRATIAHNHKLNCSPTRFNMVGQPITENAMRLDLEEAAAMITRQPHQPRVFIVNTILNHCQEVVRVTAGDPIAAHRAGVAESAAIYGVKVPRPADIVVTSSSPMDSDLRQGVKALANTIRAVKPGGVMLTFVRAEEGVGVFGLAKSKLPLGRGGLQALAPLLVRVVPRIKLSGMGEEDRFFLYFALQAMRRAKLLMYAPTFPVETRKGLPFVQFYDTPDLAFAEARKRFPGKAEVIAFPHGGITFPEMG